MEGVDSSNLYKICKGYIHDKANQKEIPYVAVNFKKNPGLLYIYEGIHPKVYQEFREAPSKGQFLNPPSSPCQWLVPLPPVNQYQNSAQEVFHSARQSYNDIPFDIFPEDV